MLNLTKVTLRARASEAVAMDLGSASADHQFDFVKELTNGLIAGKADVVFSDQRTIADGATENLDLSGGLNNAFGVAFTFAKIKVLGLHTLSTNTTVLTFGNHASPWLGPWGATGTLALGPDMLAFYMRADVDGWPVTAGTGDMIKIVNAAGAEGKYKIFIAGTSV